MPVIEKQHAAQQHKAIDWAKAGAAQMKQSRFVYKAASGKYVIETKRPLLSAYSEVFPNGKVVEHQGLLTGTK